MATFQNHSREFKSKLKTNDLCKLCFRNPVQFGKSKCNVCLVTSRDGYSDEMLKCHEAPLSMSVTVQSLDYNISAADYPAPQSHTPSAHTAIAVRV